VDIYYYSAAIFHSIFPFIDLPYRIKETLNYFKIKNYIFWS